MDVFFKHDETALAREQATSQHMTALLTAAITARPYSYRDCEYGFTYN